MIMICVYRFLRGVSTGFKVQVTLVLLHFPFCPTTTGTNLLALCPVDRHPETGNLGALSVSD